MRLPDDAEVSNELWDEVIDCMMIRVSDKAPLVRSYAVRALSRFANDADNTDILELFLDRLLLEQNVVSYFIMIIVFARLLHLSLAFGVVDLITKTFV